MMYPGTVLAYVAVVALVAVSAVVAYVAVVALVAVSAVVAYVAVVALVAVSTVAEKDPDTFKLVVDSVDPLNVNALLPVRTFV